MKLYTPSRRAFLAGLTAVLALAAALLRGLLGRRNPLVGDWRIQDYICDGKPVMNGIDVTVSITPKTVSARIRMRGHPDHIDVHNYSIRRSTQEIDMDASNGGMFLGVYSELPQGLILAWDTVGRHRPRSVDEPARFGLNRLVLTRDDSHTLSSA